MSFLDMATYKALCRWTLCSLGFFENMGTCRQSLYLHSIEIWEKNFMEKRQTSISEVFEHSALRSFTIVDSPESRRWDRNSVESSDDFADSDLGQTENGSKRDSIGKRHDQSVQWHLFYPVLSKNQSKLEAFLGLVQMDFILSARCASFSAKGDKTFHMRFFHQKCSKSQEISVGLREWIRFLKFYGFHSICAFKTEPLASASPLRRASWLKGNPPWKRRHLSFHRCRGLGNKAIRNSVTKFQLCLRSFFTFHFVSFTL